jgi:hypothetical protein
MHRNFYLEILKKIVGLLCTCVQVLDFMVFTFCLRNGHPVETRCSTAFGPVKGGIIHKVTHILCGYFKKRFRFWYLACA